ncbi:hypothetical protein [Roseicyclus marinus]|uniref:hypothetical protein n=1 Tax=Roseicyclus marinus TaxID=2161673 RepID=UPI002410869E|nr:hypothetical protein [Roseicyclus marinus]MDG3040437.1 hypothetical protein [Roseicyclus marinus]
MANRFLGEIAVDHDGASYTLRFDFNAMCDYEADTGRNAMSAIAAFEAGSIGFSDMRALIHASLVQENPDADKRLAGAILSADMDVLARLIRAAFPDPDPKAASGNGKAGKRTS